MPTFYVNQLTVSNNLSLDLNLGLISVTIDHKAIDRMSSNNLKESLQVETISTSLM